LTALFFDRPTHIALLLSLCIACSAGAQTFSTLYSFDSVNYANGSGPSGTLLRGTNGTLYGTTTLGGAFSSCPYGADQGCGTFYSLTPPAASGGPWTETVLWSFGGTPSDAYYPYGLTMGSGGVLYGVGGGAGGDAGCGSAFSLTPPDSQGAPWTEGVLYQFKCAPDGAELLYANSGLAIDANGVLYGTTYYAGAHTTCGNGCGTVFALTPPASPGGGWTETVLWSFGGKGDGIGPYAGVVIGAGGVLYGTTQRGGSGHLGIVFSLTPPAAPGGPWVETVLQDFGSAGERPVALALTADGVLFGATAQDKRFTQGGTVFSLMPPASPGGSWTKTVLWAFAHAHEQPCGPLIVDEKNGTLFGATGSGEGSGQLFKLTRPRGPRASGWTLRILNNSDTVKANLGLRSGVVLYGTDPIANIVWSLSH
jgi:uncharacterized repeat protein (TIGR03803 family)